MCFVLKKIVSKPTNTISNNEEVYKEFSLIFQIQKMMK